MAVTIDAGKLERKLSGVYGATAAAGDHVRFYWWIDGKKYGGAKISRGKKNKKDLPDFVASDIAKKLSVTRAELKEMERCSFGREELEKRLVDEG